MRLSLLMKTKNNQKYNSILIVICHITKYILFILTWNDIIAADFTELFFEHVKCHFDFLRSIVTDRDSCITFNFWWEVCEIQIIKWCLSTAYHSQTDDQSEALNKIIKDYLRIYTFKNQTVWARLLSLAQLVYNNSWNHTTQMSSNRLLHEFDCEIHIDIVNNVIKKRIPAAKDHVEKLHKLWQKLCLKLVKAQEQMTVYYNACHVSKQFKIDDFVKLFTKNLKLKCWKLSSCWIEFFRVLKQIDDQTYRLTLSTKYDHLHSIFSVQLLENYHWCHDNTELMIMSDLKNFWNK